MPLFFPIVLEWSHPHWSKFISRAWFLSPHAFCLWELHLHFFWCQHPGCGPQFCSPSDMFNDLYDSGAHPSQCDFSADSDTVTYRLPRASLCIPVVQQMWRATSTSVCKPGTISSKHNTSLLWGVGKMCLKLEPCRPGHRVPAPLLATSLT